MTDLTKTASRRVVALLATFLRIVSERQVAVEFFWDAARPLRVARTAIGRLERNELVETQTVMTHPEVILKGPVLDWHKGDPLPSFGHVSRKLQSRWGEPPVRTKIVWATARAKRLYGALGSPRKPRAKEITHDIHVAQVFFHLLRHQPELAEHWVGEDELRAQGRQGDIPDAVIAVPGGEQIIIEFGGAYDARKVRVIHQSYAQHGRYQIW